MDYQSWLEDKGNWMADYRKKTMHQMKCVTTPIVVIGMGLLMAILNLGGSIDAALFGFFRGAIGGLILMGIVLLIMSRGLSGKRVTRGIEDEIKRLGLSPAQKNLLAREMSAAEGKADSHISFTMDGPGQKGTPADVLVTQDFAMMLGGSPLVQIVNLEDIESVESGEERKSTTEYGGKTKRTTFFTLYTILFLKNSTMQVGFGFFEKSIRDKAFNMINQQMERRANNGNL